MPDYMLATGIRLNLRIIIIVACLIGLVLFLRMLRGQAPPSTDRLSAVRNRVTPTLKTSLEERGLKLGSPIFIRIFKESRELELWIRDEMGGRYVLFRTWTIANYGGGRLGPKLKEGDGIAPEGFYTVGIGQMKPDSKYHLAFNLGYPNGYDRAHQRTGSALMVHGNEVSIGCYAMTDPVVELIYLLADSALRKGQGEFQVFSFPFRMTEERLTKEAKNDWIGFWRNLKEGNDLFEKEKVPPLVGVKDKTYVFKAMQP